MTLSFITISLILGFTEFPWTAIGVVLSSITLLVLLSYNIPKFVKYVCVPKIDVSLYIYAEKVVKQKGVNQKSQTDQFYNTEFPVLPNIIPQITVTIKPRRWSYEVKTIKAMGMEIQKLRP
jgi:hypothetical protein